ncbi:MAG: YegS/Rv2252/BmrU family lipid kinase [Alistipes sp.]|nr:YegS/Rv2252/BmrU family lipid kinase [Alistipes sp.]MBR0332771.1 YegS/Rv2252/BmrU family lipid kinase [Alistipes sp.]
MKQAILLYNSQAGRGKIGRNLEQVVAIFRDAGYDITPVPLRFDGNPIKGYESVDLIVVAGGDGTLNYVVNALMRHSLSIPIGILPAGTANDFAGALGMSNNLQKAARQIAYGVVEPIDCGVVESIDRADKHEIYFVNIFSFGIFTTTSQHTPEELKHLMGRAAYMIEALKELKKVRGIPLTITADGDAFYYPTLMGLVLNGETAGRVPLARRSSLRDGVFDCLFLRKRDTVVQSAVDMMLYVLGVRTAAVKYLQASELTLVTPVSEDTDVDGQSGGRFPMRVCCLRGALNIVCPSENQ